MRTLTMLEITNISGGTATEAFGYVGGLAGAYYGAGIGASLAAPFSLIGLLFAFAVEGGPYMSGVVLSGGIFAVGLFGGAIIGSLLGASVGVASGYVTDKIVENHS